MAEAKTRCGYVSLLGAPNAGKSTLLNALVGSKVSIVTRKAQTTRTLVRGIASLENGAQIIFIDTPGLFTPHRRLERAMVKAAWSAAREGDVAAVLVDAKKGLTSAVETIIGKLKGVQAPKILLLNKIDITPRQSLLELSKRLNGLMDFERTFMVSASGGKGLQDVLKALSAYMPEGPHLYPPEQAFDAPLRQLAADITREKLFLRLHDELPYAADVETTRWQARADGSARIEQTIFVERQSQKKIVIGKEGRTIRAISTEARRELAKLCGHDVHLFLFVKVRQDWQNNPEHYRAMGLDFPS